MTVFRQCRGGTGRAAGPLAGKPARSRRAARPRSPRRSRLRSVPSAWSRTGTRPGRAGPPRRSRARAGRQQRDPDVQGPARRRGPCWTVDQLTPPASVPSGVSTASVPALLGDLPSAERRCSAQAGMCRTSSTGRRRASGPPPAPPGRPPDRPEPHPNHVRHGRRPPGRSRRSGPLGRGVEERGRYRTRARSASWSRPAPALRRPAGILRQRGAEHRRVIAVQRHEQALGEQPGQRMAARSGTCLVQTLDVGTPRAGSASPAGTRPGWDRPGS